MAYYSIYTRFCVSSDISISRFGHDTQIVILQRKQYINKGGKNTCDEIIWILKNITLINISNHLIWSRQEYKYLECHVIRKNNWWDATILIVLCTDSENSHINCPILMLTVVNQTWIIRLIQQITMHSYCVKDQLYKLISLLLK